MTPIDPPSPKNPKDEQKPEGRRGPRPGGHGSYKIGGEAATGHSWHEAPPPPPAPSGRYVPPAPGTPVNPLHTTPSSRYDDGVPHHHEPGDLLHNEDVAHEHSDISIRAVVGSAIAMIVVVGISQVLMWLAFGLLERQAASNDPTISPLASAPTAMPKNQVGTAVFTPDTVGGPQLLTNEPMALQKQRDIEEKQLQGYGWVNQGAGVARIPIDEAKKLIAGRGLPVREGAEVSPTLGTRLPARGESSGGRIITTTTPQTPEAAPATAPDGGHGQPGHGTAKPEEKPAAKPHGPGGH